jgi:hypothetical protein
MMRTTLDIDDNVLEAVKAIGRQTHPTAGAVLSDLARHALTTSPPSGHAGTRARGVGSFDPFASRGGIVTNELIDRLREGDAY